MVFFLCIWHHTASPRLHVTEAHGCLPRQLVPRPAEPSPGLTNPQTAISKVWLNQCSLQARQQPDSSPAQQPAAFKANAVRQPSLGPTATRQLSSPATSSLQAQCNQTAFLRPGGNQTNFQPGTESAFNTSRNQTALQPSNQRPSNLA